MEIPSAGAPIGICDSGAGGLTVLREMQKMMPKENFIYFGDTARLPYGSKSRRAIARASLSVAHFLAEKGIKALVVACNSSSAAALGDIKESVYPIPVLGVIEPGAQAAARTLGPRGRVGVIGTRATIESGAYQRAVRALASGAEIIAAACPLFVPLVEEGWWNDDVTARVAARYLAPFKKIKVQTLILGCTHYPLLKTVIRRELGPGVILIDSARETAAQAEVLLREKKLKNPARRGFGKTVFFVSDGPRAFGDLAKKFLGQAVGRISLHDFE